MRQLMSFKKFLDAGAPNIFFESFEEEVTEDLTGNAKVQKLKTLETLLKGHDWWYSMSDDSRAYKKGSSEQDAIRKLVDEIGSEGMKMYRVYGKKAGVMSESKDDLSPSTRASIQRYMKELDSLMKKHNWQWQFDPDIRKVKQGKKVEQQIRELVIEIKELGSIEGFDLYRKYAKKNNIKVPYFEDKTTPQLSAWEKFLYKKLKEWGLQNPEDLDALEPEPRKRFKDELDKEWASSRENKNDVVVNESVKKSNPPRNLSEAIRQVTDGSGFQKERMV
jgi:hypothetical protein